MERPQHNPRSGIYGAQSNHVSAVVHVAWNRRSKNFDHLVGRAPSRPDPLLLRAPRQTHGVHWRATTEGTAEGGADYCPASCLPVEPFRARTNVEIRTALPPSGQHKQASHVRSLPFSTFILRVGRSRAGLPIRHRMETVIRWRFRRVGNGLVPLLGDVLHCECLTSGQER